MNTGVPVGRLTRTAIALGPFPQRPGSYFASWRDGDEPGFSLDRNGPGHVANLGIDHPSPPRTLFHADGKRVLFGDRDSRVTVCDLDRLERELSDLLAGASPSPNPISKIDEGAIK